MNTKPRNYLVVHAHLRKAGAHTKTNKAQRKQQKQEVIRLLRQS